MTEEIRQYNVEIIRDTLLNLLRKYISDVDVRIENGYKALRVVNKDWSLNFWIRIYNWSDTFTIDFSSVEIPKEFRRKGIFTKVFEALKKVKIVDEIRVTSVLSVEMENWCNKNRFRDCGYNNYSYEIKRG